MMHVRYLKIINTLYQYPNLKLHFIFKQNNSFKNHQYLKIMSRNLEILTTSVNICLRHDSILLQNKWRIVTCIKHLKSPPPKSYQGKLIYITFIAILVDWKNTMFTLALYSALSTSQNNKYCFEDINMHWLPFCAYQDTWKAGY